MELGPVSARAARACCDHHPEPQDREILDILYRLGEATVEQVRVELAEAPHYSTVRALLRVHHKNPIEVAGSPLPKRGRLSTRAETHSQGTNSTFLRVESWKKIMTPQK